MLNLVNFANLPTLDFGTGTNESKLVVPMPIQLLQVGFIVSNEAFTGAAGVCTWDIQEADGTDTSPTGAAAIGTTTATSATMALNTGVWLDVNEVAGRRIVYPGEAVAADVTTTATTGIVTPFVIYCLLGFNDADMRSSVSGHAGSTTLTTALGALTKVTS